MRLVVAALLVAAVLSLPFVLWGGLFTSTFTPERTKTWLEAFGAWAWLAGIGLLSADLVLPLPATVLMSVLGFLYGPLLGGTIAAAGSFLAGCVAYAACRLLGRPAALRLVGEEDLRRGELFFERAGGWAVALSRWMPLLPEVIACLAGLARMSPLRFGAALACGSIPLGFTFALMGHLGVERPRLTLALSALVPALLWLAVGRMLARLCGKEGAT